MIVHLDPRGFGRLLDRPAEELRTLLAMLSLAPDGVYQDGERRLAARAGMRPTVLRVAIAGLAATPGPLLVVEPKRPRDKQGLLRLRLAEAPGLIVRHGDRPADRAPAGHATVPARVAVLDLHAQAGVLLADIDASAPEAGRLARAWLAHLVAVAGATALSPSAEFRQADTVLKLVAQYGEIITAEALRAGIDHVDEVHDHPERYITKAAEGIATGHGSARPPIDTPAAPTASSSRGWERMPGVPEIDL